MTRRKRPALLGAVGLMAAQVALLFPQAQNLSGTWKLDAERSHLSTAVLSGLIRAGAPGILHITQPANGTLIIESQINESHSRLYRPGGKSTTPVGPAGSITMSSRWDGRTLVSEGTLDSTSAASETVKEVLALSDEGRTLTIEITTQGAGHKSVSALVYTRTLVVEPCKNWPTPCKF